MNKSRYNADGILMHCQNLIDLDYEFGKYLESHNAFSFGTNLIINNYLNQPFLNIFVE